MKELHFEGYSDDTFGEVKEFQLDYDNCASGEPISFRVASPSEKEALRVTGKYVTPGTWQITVFGECTDKSNCQDEPEIPAWPIRFERSGRTYSPRLVIGAPDDVIVTHVRDGAS